MLFQLFVKRIILVRAIFVFGLLWIAYILFSYSSQGSPFGYFVFSRLPLHAHSSFGGFRTKSLSMMNLTDGHSDTATPFTTNSPFRKQECVHPELSVDDPFMMKFYTKKTPVPCTGEKDWVYVQNGTLRFSEKALELHKPISCDYSTVIRDGENKITYGEPILNVTDGFSIISDAFRVKCKGKNFTKYEYVHAGIAYTKERAERKQELLTSGFEGLSIAILGYDSMSRVSWLRRLRKTRKYFHDTLGAIELKQHNIVGDGTTAVMLPMLTGKFEWELPECRRGFNGSKPMDRFPFIWNDMKKAGFLTSWANAATYSAPFNWRMLGFEHPPTDFYARPFFLARDTFPHKGPCVGSQTLSHVWHNWFVDIFRMYRQQRKFLLHFITDFSHDDNNLITTIDDDIEETVRILYEGNYLNNTLLILMGDHGARYSSVRATKQGKLEERLPYFSFLFPPWFKEKYPRAFKNLLTNTNRLTTPFDLYETFRDFLQAGDFGRGDIAQRGISLFKEIPPERTCSQAGITQHWCACLDWIEVTVDDPLTKKALQAALDVINGYTEAYRTDCALLALDNVTVATKRETTADVLELPGGGGSGSRNISSSNKSTDQTVIFQLTFYTKPGGGHFEMTVKHDAVANTFSVDEREISRINKYGNDPACILQKNKQIRQYCYCNNNRAHS